jgi:Bifunctional DNA primase/polymerase, N-terminal/Primase C terminal 1 (PriCT-1)
VTSRSNDDEAAAGQLLAAALDYAGRGWPVFPLRAGGKVPLTSDGLKSATADAEQVQAWWQRWPDANVAIRTGRESGLVVLDVDVQRGGAGTLKQLEQERGKLPQTPRVLTGGGGWHIYFQHPGDEVRNSAGRLGPGLDVRGDGGYVVGPPSVHESGRRYQWMNDSTRLAALLAWLTDAPRQNGSAPRVAGVIPAGQRRDRLLSLAGTMRRRGLDKDEILAALAAVNEKRCQPPLEPAELAVLARDVGKRYRAAEQLGKTPYAGPELGLADVFASFRRWLHLPDAGAICVALATVVANRLPGDPVWLLLVGASSSGKTEVLVSLAGLEEVEPAATLTEAALLSGVPRREVASGASGGLLRKIGDYGILTLKDFGSVLSMHRDARAAVLAALRECYDGGWDRPIGADGGRVLSWRGKLGLIAGVTTVVDRHHAVIDSLGSRFAFYRVEIASRDAQAGRSLEHRRRTAGMRDELREAVAGFVAGLELPGDKDTLSDDDKRRLIELADFVTLARSPVERDSYHTREIELVPDAEAPARFVNMLASLLEGLRVIGLDDDTAWRLTTKVALDSMPAQRRLAIEHLQRIRTTTTKDAAVAIGVPTTTTRRTLEDLAAHGVVLRTPGGQPGEPDTWQLAPTLTVPETSQLSKNTHTAYDDISGTGV